MNETIEKLIASGKEGPWWDFKQTYHQNNAALVHDILCMANVLHDGDRYQKFDQNTRINRCATISPHILVEADVVRMVLHQ